MQAAGAFIPPRLTWQHPTREHITGAQEADGFVLAHQAAQKALDRLRTWSVAGV